MKNTLIILISITLGFIFGVFYNAYTNTPIMFAKWSNGTIHLFVLTNDHELIQLTPNIRQAE